MRGTSLLVALALFVAAGTAACAARPAAREARPVERPPGAAAGAVDPYYVVRGPTPRAVVTSTRCAARYEVLDVSIPPRTGPSPRTEEARPIRLVWYRPLPTDERPRPAVLVSPILGSDTSFVTGFAEAFAREGWHAFIVRRPKVEYDPSRPLEQAEEGLRLSVVRQVQALDWVLAQPCIDGARIGGLGISAGGITEAMVAGADPRYVAHVVALAGGPLADVMLDTDEKDFAVLVDRASVREGVPREALRARLREIIRTDPVRLAPRVDREGILLVLARYDHAVPTRYGRTLDEALGRPEAILLPLGHYSSVLALPFLTSRTLEFLRRRFGTRAATR